MTVEQRIRASNILVCHRREDAAPATRLAAVLSRHGTIRRRDDAAANSTLAEDDIRNSSVLILVIGPHWLESTNKHGIRRIDDPDDPVRRYLDVAGRYNHPLIVALVDGARVPTTEELPANLWFLTVSDVRVSTIDESLVNTDLELSVWLKEIAAGLEWKFRPIGATTIAMSGPMPQYHDRPAIALPAPAAPAPARASGLGRMIGSIGGLIGGALGKLRRQSTHSAEPPSSAAPSPIELAPAPEIELSTDLQNELSKAVNVDPVLLGASAPQQVKAGSEFTARLVAYLEHQAAAVEKELSLLSPRSTSHLGLKTCQWQHGTKATVTLIAHDVVISPPTQTFIWNGERVMLEFDVVVPPNIIDSTIVLKFDVSIEGIVVARLRLDLQIVSRDSAAQPPSTPAAFASVTAARTAFASYSSKDRQRVLDRVAAVHISAGLDIFLDCMSLNPSEKWKPRLGNEIRTRDLFLLFWSADAARSQWVTWEWQTALREKGKSAMQIHPLQADISPPEELKDLHFGDVYMLVREQNRTTKSVSSPS